MALSLFLHHTVAGRYGLWQGLAYSTFSIKGSYCYLCQHAPNNSSESGLCRYQKLRCQWSTYSQLSLEAHEPVSSLRNKHYLEHRSCPKHSSAFIVFTSRCTFWPNRWASSNKNPQVKNMAQTCFYQQHSCLWASQLNQILTSWQVIQQETLVLGPILGYWTPMMSKTASGLGSITVSTAIKKIPLSLLLKYKIIMAYNNHTIDWWRSSLNNTDHVFQDRPSLICKERKCEGHQFVMEK